MSSFIPKRRFIQNADGTVRWLDPPRYDCKGNSKSNSNTFVFRTHIEEEEEEPVIAQEELKQAG